MPSSPSLTRRDALLGAVGTRTDPAAAKGAAPVRGVTDTEIIVGTMTDLSGVTAVLGLNEANAMRLAFDEANERGGIHGRRINYIVCKCQDCEHVVLPRGHRQVSPQFSPVLAMSRPRGG